MATRVPLEELVQELPEDLKAEVYEFARFLLAKRLREEDRRWSRFSLAQASRGLEQEEDLYTEADLKVRWQ